LPERVEAPATRRRHTHSELAALPRRTLPTEQAGRPTRRRVGVRRTRAVGQTARGGAPTPRGTRVDGPGIDDLVGQTLAFFTALAAGTAHARFAAGPTLELQLARAALAIEPAAPPGARRGSAGPFPTAHEREHEPSHECEEPRAPDDHLANLANAGHDGHCARHRHSPAATL
jgi:hypothetical protein